MNPTPKGWPRITPAIFYLDAARAIDWLCDAFGFEVRLKVEGEGGQIVHSELVLGSGVIMVTEGEGPHVRPYHKSPAQVGGANTQNMFVYVDDIEAHCARARAKGATITREPTIADYGDDYWVDKGYECVDHAGHRWWFAQRVRDGAGFQPKLVHLEAEAAPKGWPRIASTAYYEDAAAAIDWLCKAFGFEVQIKVEGEGGKIEHSELVLAGGLVMVSDAKRDRAKWPDRRTPHEIGGVNTQNLMLYVDDVKAHCERARAAGATIETEPEVKDYGEDYWSDLSYAAIDLGGHHWWITQRLRG